jgi:hypothetical protein
MSLTIQVQFYDVPQPVTYTIPWSPSMTIQAAMEACFNQYSGPHSQQPFTFWIQYYGTYNTQFIGYMPISINGRHKAAQYIWFVYLNNVVANNSLDAVTLNPGDSVAFKYQPFASSNIAAGSIYHAMIQADLSFTKPIN